MPDETNNIKDAESVIREITRGFRGDTFFDLLTYRVALEVYRDHPQIAEIQKKSLAALYANLPDDEKREFEESHQEEIEDFMLYFKPIEHAYVSDRFEDLIPMCESLIQEVENADKYQNSETEEYIYCPSEFEYALYRFDRGSEKEIVRIPLAYPDLYSIYASALTHFHQHLEARSALRKALRWCPLDNRINADYIETFRATGDLEEFRNLTLEAFEMTYRGDVIARLYRNLAYVFEQKKLDRPAAACYKMCFHFNEHSRFYDENYSPELLTHPASVSEMTLAEAKQCLKEHGVPQGADSNLIAIAAAMTKEAHTKRLLLEERVVYMNLYEMTQDENIRPQIERINRALARENRERSRPKRPLSPAQKAKKNRKRRKK